MIELTSRDSIAILRMANQLAQTPAATLGFLLV
jgi:hypothetical protein